MNNMKKRNFYCPKTQEPIYICVSTYKNHRMQIQYFNEWYSIKIICGEMDVILIKLM